MSRWRLFVLLVESARFGCSRDLLLNIPDQNAHISALSVVCVWARVSNKSANGKQGCVKVTEFPSIQRGLSVGFCQVKAGGLCS